MEPRVVWSHAGFCFMRKSIPPELGFLKRMRLIRKVSFKQFAGCLGACRDTYGMWFHLFFDAEQAFS
ncbi:MAG TPA: hypothetical protein VLA21_04560, partial [Candidatus Limnocylindria bacterium]|nr:hypothetical protein [Candidatus Limnocylindria bacterium]